MSSVVATGLVEVRLYGVLGKRFGRVHRLAVASVREAAQALVVLLPGFGRHLLEHSEPGYQVFIGLPGGEPRDQTQLDAPVSARERICIVPVVAGAKRAGLGQVILGAVLIGLTFWNPLGLFAGQFAAFAGAGSIGAALVLGGVVQMLSPQPKGGSEPRIDGLPSYHFGGPVNTSQQGMPVPLVYGRVITGGVIVSAGILTEEIVPASGGSSLPAQPLPPEQPLDPLQSPEYGA